jgi:hypothetical protein
MQKWGFILFYFVHLTQTVCIKRTFLELILLPSFDNNSLPSIQRKFREFITRKSNRFQVDLIPELYHNSLLKIREIYSPEADTIYERFFFSPCHHYYMMVHHFLTKILLTLRYPSSEKEFQCSRFYFNDSLPVLIEVISQIIPHDPPQFEEKIKNIMTAMELRCNTKLLGFPPTNQLEIIKCPFDTKFQIIQDRWAEYVRNTPVNSIKIYEFSKDPLWNLKNVTIIAKQVLMAGRLKSGNDYTLVINQLGLLHDYFMTLTYLEHTKLHSMYRTNFRNLFEWDFKLSVTSLCILTYGQKYSPELHDTFENSIKNN